VVRRHLRLRTCSLSSTIAECQYIMSSAKPLATPMWPNPPVNADACGRAAMCAGWPARAGYRAR
jgi:hypothetical protein